MAQDEWWAMGQALAARTGRPARRPSSSTKLVVLGIAAVLSSCETNLARSSYDGGDAEVGTGGMPGAGGRRGSGGAPGTGGVVAMTGGAPGLPDGSATGSGGTSNGSAGTSGSGGTGGALADAGLDAPAGGDGPGGSGTDAASAGAGGGGGAASDTDAGPPCVPVCPPGGTCRAGVCVCPEDMAVCAGYCVDTRSARDHCGNCLTTCDDGCTAGRCYKTIVKGSGLPSGGFAINATDIYFADREKGTLSRAPRDGGTATVLVAGESNVGGFALDGDTLYWTRFVTSGGICTMPLSGGACTEVATSENPYRIALDPTNVYWSTYTAHFVKKVSKKGGEVTVLASEDNADGASNLVTDAKNLYWTSLVAGGTVFKVPLAGGTVVSLANGIGGVDNSLNLAVTRGNVYFVETPATAPQRLLAIGAGGGAITPIADVRSNSMIADEAAIYFERGSSITRLDLDTGITTDLADEEQLSFMAVEGNDLFWQSVTGDIKSIPKKP